MEEIQLTAADDLKLSLAVFEAKETRALVQIIHGATEHKERYYNFAEFLTTRGITVIISDNRGHGASINNEYPLGFMNGFDEIVADQVRVTKYIKERYPGEELHLIGHSIGSLFARIYLRKHDIEIKKLVLSGTVNYNPAVGLGIILGKIISVIKGKHGISRILNWLSNNRKDDTWISASQTNLEEYRNDPLCGYDYPNSSTLTVFEADRELHKYKNFECKNPDMEILSVSGEGDPITGGAKGLKDSVDSLKKIGYKNIKNIVYPDMKHEVLNETKKMQVYEDIVRFLLK